MNLTKIKLKFCGLPQCHLSSSPIIIKSPRIPKQQGRHLIILSAYLHHDRYKGIDKNNDEHSYTPLIWYTHYL